MRRSKLSRSDRDGGILPKHLDSDYMPARKGGNPMAKLTTRDREKIPAKKLAEPEKRG